MAGRSIRLCALSLLVSIILGIKTPPVLASEKDAFVRDNKCSSKKLIALTFDDGPFRKYDAEILDILDRYSVKATFFMVGENIVREPALAAEIAARGHEIGNHTFSHRKLKTQSKEELSYELSLTSRLISAVCNRDTSLFRPPEGFVSDTVSAAALEGGYSLVLWSVDTLDWTGRGCDEIVRTVEENTREGGIILCHDCIYKKSGTARAMERFIPKMQKKGYTFVTVSELLRESTDSAVGK